MCMICVDYQLKKLTATEAFRNLDEMVRCNDITEDHGIEIVAMVLDIEMDDILNDLNIVLDNVFI